MSTPDLTSPSVLDALAWADAHTRDLDMVVGLARRGITDLDAIMEHGRAAWDLVESLPADETFTAADLPVLAVVSARVWVEDRDNASEWAAVFSEAHNADEDMDEFLDAGRGPSYARDLLALLDRTGKSVHHVDLTQPVAAIADLLDANITAADLAAYAELGLDRAAAIAASADGITVAHARFLVEDGVPQADWAPFARIPHRWIEGSGSFGYPRAHGWTMRLLLDTVDAGWGRDGHFDRPWTLRDTDGGFITPDGAQLLLGRGAKPEAIRTMAMAWGARARSTLGNTLSTALRLDPQAIDVLHRLRDRGVRASHAPMYAAIGANTAGEVLAAVQAGITPERAAYLRETYGHTYRYDGSHKTIEHAAVDTSAALIALHQRDAESEAQR